MHIIYSSRIKNLMNHNEKWAALTRSRRFCEFLMSSISPYICVPKSIKTKKEFFFFFFISDVTMF